METQEVSEEIVIVASRYEGLSDVIKPLCEKGEPIGREELVRLIGGEEVYLNPRYNKYDAYAVGVYTAKQVHLGYIWMQQSPSLLHWMTENNKNFVSVRIDRFNTKTGLMMAKPSVPMNLIRVTRSAGIDMDWAKDLPLVITDIKQQGLEMGLFVLRGKLEAMTEWDDSLMPMLDNVFRYLETDLSDYCYGESIDVYKAMRRSPIEKVREIGEEFLKSLVDRGSKESTQWWVDQWLPAFMQEAMRSDLLGVYEKSGYTLEMVEELLKEAPLHLYQMYNVNRARFAKQLYYAALPPKIFYRLLTLLTLREALKGGINENINENDNMELFHFIHPALDEEEELKIHNEVLKLVRRQGVQMICQHLLEMKEAKKLLLPPNPSVVYEELVRMGMPCTGGFNESTFRKYYSNR